jgi:hypothetical protein
MDKATHSEKASFRFMSLSAEAEGLSSIKIIAVVCLAAMVTMIAMAAIIAFSR